MPAIREKSPTDSAPVASRPPRRIVLGDSLVLGLLATIATGAFSWVPSVWYDEGATVASATRSWAGLAAELEVVDIVHAIYYVIMHAWFDLVGYSPFTLRLPSAIAIGAATAGIVALLHHLADRRTAIIAGVVFVLIPRVFWAGGEGRSFAIGTALTVALVAVFVGAARRSGGPRRIAIAWWSGYALLGGLTVGIFIYTAFAVAAMGVSAAWLLLRDRTTTARAVLLGWAAAATVAALVSSPVLLGAASQSGQVFWIPPVSWTTFKSVILSQFFYGWEPLAGIFWPIAIAGVVLGLARDVHRPRGSAVPTLSQLMLPLLVVPPVGIVAASLVVSPLYSPRYLTFTAPAFAVFVAIAIATVRSRIAIAAILAALIAFFVPVAVDERSPQTKQDSSWSEVAALISRERAEEPRGTTEAIVYGTLRYHPSATARVTAYAYPGAFEGLRDVTLRESIDESGQLWETEYPLAERLDRLEDVDVVWLVTSTSRDQRPYVTSTLARAGFFLEEEWHLEGVRILRYRPTEDF